MSYFFQVQTIAPQGNLGEVQLLASIHPVVPAVQTSLWRSGADAETTSARLDLSVAATVPASVPSQPPVSASSPTFELPKASCTSSDTFSVTGKPQFSVPDLVSAPASVTLPTSVQAADPSLAPVPVAASIPAAALQPAGIQTTVPVPEHASLAITQQNLETTSVSSTLQQEPRVEVGIKPNVAPFLFQKNQIVT